jgi:predicted DNA-binding protein (UPF0251 family)
MLAGAISPQRFEPIARRDPKILKSCRRIEHRQLSARSRHDIRREAFRHDVAKDRRRPLAAKALDHGRYVTRNGGYVKRNAQDAADAAY